VKLTYLAFFISLGILPTDVSFGTLGRIQESQHSSPVKIVGLKLEYLSCEPVEFKIVNTTRGQIYVTAYAERFINGSWVEETYPYAINDLNSLNSKIVKANRLKVDESLPILYKRCLRPTFVQEDDKEFSRSIANGDIKASGDVMQRIRVEIRVDDHGRKLKVWSEQFKRSPDGTLIEKK
jgi:hypothetical protein